MVTGLSGPIRSVIIRVIILLAVKKKNHLSARVMARTVQLLRHDACCPITVHAQLRLKSGQLIANQI